jgi:hypothetical protein
MFSVPRGSITIIHRARYRTRKVLRSGSHAVTPVGGRRKTVTLPSAAATFLRALSSSFSMGIDWIAPAPIGGHHSESSLVKARQTEVNREEALCSRRRRRSIVPLFYSDLAGFRGVSGMALMFAKMMASTFVSGL